MAVRCLTAAFVVAAALGPSVATGASPEEVVEVFRRGCFDHLPDFAGSKATFRELGFEGDRGMKRPDPPGLGMKADIYRESANRAAGCSVISVSPVESDIRAALAAMVAEAEDIHFSRKEGEEGGVRKSVFAWREGSLRIVVTSMQPPTGAVEIIAWVSEVPE
ncbi:MAG: hypothetical protein V3R90_07390 [Limibaculum sp.]